MAFLSVLFLSGTLVVQGFANDAGVGKIQFCSGAVLIDAFGKNAFIPAIQGDALYSSSVIRSESNGRASLLVQDQRIDVAPHTVVRVSDLLSTAARKKGMAWFKSLGHFFQSMSGLSGSIDDERVLGARAGNAGSAEQGSDASWQTADQDPGELIEGAKKLVQDGSYVEALDKLSDVGPVPDGEMSWEVAFLRGYCFFQAADYANARTNLGQALAQLKSSGAARGTFAMRRTLFFQLGVCNYLLGDENAAIPLFEAVRESGPGTAEEPYASLLLCKALIATGETARARQIAAEASKDARGSDIEAELLQLAKGP